MTAKKSSLTKTEQRILEIIEQFILSYGKSPTLNEIASAAVIQSRGTVHRYVSRLIAKGYVEKFDGWRGLQLTDQNDGSLPLLGRIEAGRPIEAIPGKTKLVVERLFQRSNYYALEVSGDSMKEVGILNGDYVIIASQHTIQSGEIVVALIDNTENTLKRIQYNEDGLIELHPENKSFEVMSYAPERVQIQGVMVGLLRICNKNL